MSTEVTEDINSLPVQPSSAPKKIPIELLIYYANKGLSDSEIARQVGCSKVNVFQRLKDVGYSRERVDEFKKSRADINAFIQSLIATHQIAFLNHPDTKISDFRELKEAGISKGIEFQREQEDRGKLGDKAGDSAAISAIHRELFDKQGRKVAVEKEVKVTGTPDKLSEDKVLQKILKA